MGALTLKNLEGGSRQWELSENESFDLTDSFGTIIRIVSKEKQAFFVEPCDPSQPWLSDRGRFFFEGAVCKTTFHNNLSRGSVKKTFFKTLFFFNHFRFKENLSPLVFVFKRLGLEVLSLVKSFESRFSFFSLREESSFFKDLNFENRFLVGLLKESWLSTCSFVVLVGLNARYESYVLSLALRQRLLKGSFKLACVGPALGESTRSVYLGSCLRKWDSVGCGSNVMCLELTDSDQPLFLASTSFFRGPIFKSFLEMSYAIKLACKSSQVFSAIPDKIETSGNCSLGPVTSFCSKDVETAKVVFHVNSDFSESAEIKSIFAGNVLRLQAKKSTATFNLADIEFHQMLNDLQIKDFVEKNCGFYFYLPTKNPFEESTTYLNAEGAVRKSFKVGLGRGQKFSCWSVLYSFYSACVKVKSLVNRKDNFKLSGLLANRSRQENFFSFIFRAVRSTTSETSSFSFSFAVFDSLKSAKRNKFRRFKLIGRRSKIKFKFDDSFVGGEKDSFSSNSSTLLKSSELARSQMTNFF